MTKPLELKTAIDVLEYHQKWRLGEIHEMIYTPRQITESLDIIIKEVKKQTLK